MLRWRVGVVVADPRLRAPAIHGPGGAAATILADAGISAGDDPEGTMAKRLRDAAVFGAVGLLLGIGPALLVAGAYATWFVGGAIEDVSITTIFDFVAWREPWNAAVTYGLGVLLGCAGAGIIIAFKPRRAEYGSARWANARDLKRGHLLDTMPERAIAPLLGKLGRPGGRGAYLSSSRFPHTLVAAPTGAGKGVGVVIPTLLTYRGCVVVLDVKGENFALTARRRRAIGDRVYKFAPYDEQGRTHRFNPLDDVARVAERRRYTEARRLAASLIVAKGQSAEGFIEGAREVFAALCLTAIEQGTPTIGAVYDLVSQGGDGASVFEKLATQTGSPEAKKVFNRMAGTDSRILSSYLSVLSDGGLSLWADPAVRDATSATDFSLYDLRRKGTSVFVVVSPNDLVPLAPLVRILFQQAIAILQRAEPGPDEKLHVLFLMDEFASLGRMEVLSSAITTLRSYAGRVMIVVQSLATLKDLYGQDGAANLMANCGLQLFMAPSDGETPKYISEAIGDYTREARSVSKTPGQWRRSVQIRHEGARLIRPEDLRTLDKEKVVVLIQNSAPALLHRISYFKDRVLKRLFEQQTGPLPEPAVSTASEAASDRATGKSGRVVRTMEPETPGPPSQAEERRTDDLRDLAQRQKALLDLAWDMAESSRAGQRAPDEATVDHAPKGADRERQAGR